MVDTVQSSQNNVTPSQRSQQAAVVVGKKSNTILAQTLINKTQSAAPSTQTGGLRLVGSKPAGFSTNLPRGSLVDEIV